MTTPSPSAPAFNPIPRGCLCRHADGTIGSVWPDVRTNRTEGVAVVLGKYRMAIQGSADPRDTSWQLDIDRADLHVLSFEEVQEHDRRQRAAEKVRRVIGALLHCKGDFAGRASLFERAEIEASL